METFLTLTLTCIAAVAAENTFPNPIWAPAPATQCYKCTEFSDQGQGFVEYPDHKYCCYYYECWRVDEADTLSGVLRLCPTGTWWDPLDGPHGSPCIDEKPYPECDDTCPPLGGGTWTPGTCPYWPKIFPAGRRWKFGRYTNPIPSHEFQITPFSIFHPRGVCKSSDYVFDRDACTCLPVLSGSCKCMANITLADDYLDHSCMCGNVFESGDEIEFVEAAPIPTGRAAVFPGKTAKSHLNAEIFSGLYSGCWVKKLSVGVFLNVNEFGPVGIAQGVVCYASCEEGGIFMPVSYGIGVRNTGSGGEVIANIADKEVKTSIVANKWYYVSFTYKYKGGGQNLKLYLHDIDEEEDCRENGNCNGPADSDSIGKVCIDPRACGLEIGFTGTSVNEDEFFNGMISRVQVAHDINIMVCE